MAKPIRLRPIEPKGKYVKKFPDRPKSSWNIYELYNKEERKVLKEKVIDMYTNQKLLPSDIARILTVPVGYVNRMVKDPKIPRLATGKVNEDNLKIASLAGVSFTDETKTAINTTCVVCNNPVVIPRAKFVAAYLNKNRITYAHTECYYNDLQAKRIATREKMKNNKTGYIGVSVKDGVKGTQVTVSIMSGWKNLFYKKVIVTDKNEIAKTILNLAMLREEFIVINDLTHTRNFTNRGLLDHIKTIVHEENMNNLKRLKELEERIH